MSKKLLNEEFTWTHPTKGQIRVALFEQPTDVNNALIRVVLYPIDPKVDAPETISDFFKQLKNLGKWEQFKKLKNELDEIKSTT